MQRKFLSCVWFAGVLAALGCGGGSGSPNPPANNIAVTITPSASTALVASPLKFAATVTGSSDTGVTFSIVEGQQGGQMAQNGDYLAPKSPGVYHVRATSKADVTKFADAAVTVRDYLKQVQRAADLPQPRDYSTVTLLPDGSLLIAGGGTMYASIHQQAERFSPTENRYAPIATMIAPRLAHASTLLPDGKVLITGGWDGVSTEPLLPVLKSSEIFDPQNSAFTAGPQMTVPRWHHTSTLLKDGRILLTGGLQLFGTGIGASPNAEIYDPNTNTFTAVGRMVESGRFRHTATLLSDGRVLLIGGRNNNCTANCPIYSLNSAEIFDPASNTFTATGPLNISRYWHTATLLEDGRVLVLGGESLEDLGTDSDQVQDAEIYDPTTGQFTLYGKTFIPRGQHTATMLNNGQLLLAGGVIRNGTPTQITEFFNPLTGTSTRGPDLQEHHVRHSAIRLHNGEVVILGGSNVYQPILISELFR